MSISILSASLSPIKLAYYSYKHDWCLPNMKKSSLLCQSSENVIKPGSFSFNITQRSSILTTSDHMVLPANNTLVKASVSCNGTSNPLLDKDKNAEIGIVKFLIGKNLFVTGATGFLAKVLIEKILRTVPEVGKIFILINAKSKEAAMQRLQDEIIDVDLFKCLRQTYGKTYQDFMSSKLVPVLGNIGEYNLGLEEHTVEVLGEQIDIIVNSGANTNFHERYDVALNINMRGQIRIMDIAKKCKNLKLFLHVSTAYVNGQRKGIIMEKPFLLGDSMASENITLEAAYRPINALTIENEAKLVLDKKKSFNDNALPYRMKELGLERARKHGWHDTYVFTKVMGEMMIDSMRGDIPVVIIRPSTIESTYKDPFPGWIQGYKVLEPLIVSYGKGILTCFPMDPNGPADVIPADMVVNAALAAMAKHGLAGKPGNDVYQVASSGSNPLLFQKLYDDIYLHFKSMPFIDSKGTPIDVLPMKFFNTENEFLSYLRTQETELDVVATSNEKSLERIKIAREKIAEKLKDMANIYSPYTLYGGRFDNSNTKSLLELMSEEEKKTFGFDVDIIDWSDYILKVHIPGVRKHILKGRMDSKL